MLKVVNILVLSPRNSWNYNTTLVTVVGTDVPKIERFVFKTWEIYYWGVKGRGSGNLSGKMKDIET